MKVNKKKLKDNLIYHDKTREKKKQKQFSFPI